MDDTRDVDSDPDSHDVDPSAELLAAATLAVPEWLWRCIDGASQSGGVTIAHDSDVEHLIDSVGSELLGRLERLLATDVEAQRQTPLSLFREAVAAPTALLVERRVPPVRRDPFAVEAFADDVYGLTPATWGDIDPSLQAPGIAWGAWKAMTVIRRHR